MISDWIFDHFGWLLLGAGLVLTGLVLWLVLSGSTNCPKGQISKFAYYQPMVVTVGKSVIVEEIPIFTCQAGHD